MYYMETIKYIGYAINISLKVQGLSLGFFTASLKGCQELWRKDTKSLQQALIQGRPGSFNPLPQGKVIFTSFRGK